MQLPEPNPGIADLQPYKPGKPISSLQRELGIKEVIKLASNESLLSPSKLAIAAMDASLEELQRYPDDGFELKNLLASHHSVTTEQITLANGSDELFNFILKVFCNATSEVIVSEYAFAAYAIAVKAAGCQLCTVPAAGFAHDLAAFAAAVTPKTKVIFIANPNNPTGTWNTAAELLSLLEQVPSNVVVVVDQAYFEYMLAADYPDPVKWLVRFPNLVVTRTFSKAYSLAGLRLGYAVASAQISDFLNRVRLPFNVNSLALVAGVATLQDFSHLQQNLKLTRSGLQQWLECIQQLQLEYLDPVGNFITVKIGPNAPEVYERLLQRGIIVRPLQPYGMAEYLRITVGTMDQNKQAIAALTSTLEEFN